MSGSQATEWIAERLERWRGSRDAEALGELMKWQRDRAYAVASRLLGRQADAEDAVQRAFVKLLSRTRGFEDEEAFRAAVYRAVVQTAIDGARADRRRKLREDAMSAGAVHQSRFAEAPTAAERAEAAGIVREELDQLSLEDRAAVVMCCQEGLSTAQAASALDVPSESLRDRVARSLKDLRRRLKRRGVGLSVIALVALFRQSAAEAAPSGLCSALDAAIPGAPCSSIPAAAVSQMSAAVIASGLGGAAAVNAKIAAIACASAIGVWAIAGSLTSLRGERAEEARPAATAEARAVTTDEVEEVNGRPEGPAADQADRKEEEEMMRKKVAALVLGAALAGNVVVASPAKADEPDPAKVARIVARIKTYRAKKAKTNPMRPGGKWNSMQFGDMQGNGNVRHVIIEGNPNGIGE